MKEMEAGTEFWGVNMSRCLLLLLCLLLYLSLNPGQVFSQQAPLLEGAEGFSSPGWVLGDVIALDLEGNQLTAGYIDDGTNEEKEIAVAIYTQTRYESVNSLSDIKVGDVVAIDYRITPEGKAAAVNISVERIKREEE